LIGDVESAGGWCERD